MLDPRLPVRTVSQKFIRADGGKMFNGLWGRPTKTADFGTSLWQIPYANNICLLEDKIQKWGTFLFTISYGSHAMDQRSGDGWISGWSDIIVFCKRNSNARFWSTRCEDCFGTEPNHPVYPLQEKGQSGGTKSPKKETVSFVEDRSLTWSTSTSGSLEPMILSRIMPTYSQFFFEMMIFRNSIQNDTEFYLSMTQIPSDDILESLYKLRIRESEKLKTVLELYNMEIHQKKAGPDYHRLKTMVKRSIEENLRMKNFEARKWKFWSKRRGQESWVKQREQWGLGYCWQWKANGQVSKEDNCSFRHEMNKRAKSTQPDPSPRSSTQQSVTNASRTRSLWGRSLSGKIARLPCKDYLKGTCTTPFCEKWHPLECWFHKSENGCSFGEKCSCAHFQVDEQLSMKSQKNGDKSAVAILKITRQLSCVFQDMEPPKSFSILRKSSNILKPIRCVRFTKAMLRHANIRNSIPSLGMICPGDPHQRNPNAPKFENRSQEETEWQERWSSVEAGQKYPKIKGETENSIFFSL